MCPAGAPRPIAVQIAQKTFRTAAGEIREVFRDFTLQIEAGEVRALVGPSGCGKTTLLRLIIGLDRDYSGTITLPPETRVGVAFQEPRLLPWRSVYKNLRLAAPMAHEADLIKIATDLGLGEHLTHYPGELSLGLARRVALARAFAVNPNLLVLDEPFVSLDQPLALRLRQDLGLLVERRKLTTLLVTHDLDEAIGLADRITFLAGQPTRIKGEIPIKLPRHRLTPELAADIKREIAALLGQPASYPDKT
jgi:ABC-type nitrate/sulfonate/bicarbonate transport system ATPase subunit